MRKTIFLMLLLSFISRLSAEIQFRDLNSKEEWEEVFNQAQQEEKYVLVFMYTDWCGYCKKMKKEVFPNDSIKSALSDDFIKVKINGEGDFGKIINVKYEISGFPTSLYLTPKQELLGQINGFANVETFYTKSQALKSYKKEAINYQRKFTEGNLDKEETLRYLILLKETQQKRLTKEVAESYLGLVESQELLEVKNQVVLRDHVIDLESEHYNYAIAHEIAIVEQAGEAYYDAFVKNVFNTNLNEAIDKKDDQLVENIIEGLLKKYLSEESIEEGIAGVYQKYYLGIQNWSLYNKSVLGYYNNRQGVDYLCDRVVLVLSDYTDTKEMVGYAQDWMGLVEKKQENYKIKVLSAHVLIYQEAYSEALKSAKKAKKMAVTVDEQKSADELILMIESKIVEE